LRECQNTDKKTKILNSIFQRKSEDSCSVSSDRTDSDEWPPAFSSEWKNLLHILVYMSLQESTGSYSWFTLRLKKPD